MTAASAAMHITSAISSKKLCVTKSVGSRAPNVDISAVVSASLQAHVGSKYISNPKMTPMLLLLLFDPVQAPPLGHAFESVNAAILKADSRLRHQILDRA